MFEGTNLHKSPEAWERMQTRTGKRKLLVRSAHMDHSPNWREREFAPISKRRSRKSVATTNTASDKAYQPHLRNRRKVVIDR